MVNRQISLDGGGALLVWRTTESQEDLLQNLQLPENRAEYLALRTDKRRLEFSAVRVALKKLLGREFHIFYEKSGKPFLPDNCCKIGISHSREWVAVAIHPSFQVGVDIECPTEKVLRVYKRFLSEAEQKALSDGTDIKKLQIAWSAKEALYKIIGEEAVDFASQMRIYPFELQAEGEFVMEHVVSGGLYRMRYVQNDEYTLVWAIDNEQLTTNGEQRMIE